MKTPNLEREFLEAARAFKDENGNIDLMELSYTLFVSLKNLANNHKKNEK
ncbi:hypothetical protein [Campylobacter portucalensis]|nr:hypothetical protein [Campylobacter portucalensis]